MGIFPSLMSAGGAMPSGWDPSSPLGYTLSGPKDSIASLSPSVAGAVVGVAGHYAGKWYLEISLVNLTSGADLALSPKIANSAAVGYGGAGLGVSFNSEGDVTGHDSGVSAAFSSGPGILAGTIMMAADFDANLMWCGRNGSWINVTGYAASNPGAGTGGVPLLPTLYYPAVQVDQGANTATLRTVQSQFAIARPAGFAPWGS